MALVAIETIYRPATGCRPSAIVARRMDDPHGGKNFAVIKTAMLTSTGEDAHAIAVQALCDKWEWHGKLAPGATRTGYVWTWVPDTTPSPATGPIRVYTV